ncbi:MAG: hypothetical protein ACHQ4H_15505 [Ktedonobacterales bacterium]
MARRRTTKQPKRHAARSHQPRVAVPTVAATHRVTGAATSGQVPPPRAPRAAGSMRAMQLDAPGSAALGGVGLADVLLELVGAEHADLRATLAVWQREQDRVLNRAWRRPGGLARPAGL